MSELEPNGATYSDIFLSVVVKYDVTETYRRAYIPKQVYYLLIVRV